MREKKFKIHLLNKVESSSLFQMYSQAFEEVTNCKLFLSLNHEDEAHVLHTVPVSAGVGEVFYLKARLLDGVSPLDKEDQSSFSGLLDVFSVQLEDEVNAAIVDSVDTEPYTLKKAKQYINERLHGKVTLNEVAAANDICAFQLCRLFKKHSGITMTEYVSRKRIESAKSKLREANQQITQVAHDVGFTSISQFNRNFLKYVGVAPTEFREQSRKLYHCNFDVI